MPVKVVKVPVLGVLAPIGILSILVAADNVVPSPWTKPSTVVWIVKTGLLPPLEVPAKPFTLSIETLVIVPISTADKVIETLVTVWLPDCVPVVFIKMLFVTSLKEAQI